MLCFCHCHIQPPSLRCCIIVAPPFFKHFVVAMPPSLPHPASFVGALHYYNKPPLLKKERICTPPFSTIAFFCFRHYCNKKKVIYIFAFFVASKKISCVCVLSNPYCPLTTHLPSLPLSFPYPYLPRVPSLPLFTSCLSYHCQTKRKKCGSECIWPCFKPNTISHALFAITKG